MYPAVLSTDLHLTDAEPDEYRWSVFDRFIEAGRKHKAESLVLLGDLTDAKDFHSARLVNRIVGEVTRMLATFERVIILKGNHDYLNKESPFFEFLSAIKGVHFVVQPTRIGRWLFLPHSREVPLPGLDLVDSSITHCFLHQTVAGAIASNGQEMEGELPSTKFRHADTCQYMSGDIHVPQRCGVVEYVGSPYPVHFGDAYRARFLVLLGPGRSDIKQYFWDGLTRHTVTIKHPKELAQLDIGDQLKVRLALSQADLADWHEMKREVQRLCDLQGVRLVSCELVRPATRRQLLSQGVSMHERRTITHSEVLERYCAARKVDGKTAEVGEEILRGVRYAD